MQEKGKSKNASNAANDQYYMKNQTLAPTQS